jgi:hypothetical protein
MTETELTTIKVTQDAWRQLRETADAEGRKMWALASDLIRKGLAARVENGLLVADEREPQQEATA